MSRLKENVEKLTEERDQRSTSENREKEQNKRLQRQIRDIKEETVELAKKENEASRKKHELVRFFFGIFLSTIGVVLFPVQCLWCVQFSAYHACPVLYLS